MMKYQDTSCLLWIFSWFSNDLFLSAFWMVLFLFLDQGGNGAGSSARHAWDISRCDGGSSKNLKIRTLSCHSSDVFIYCYFCINIGVRISLRAPRLIPWYLFLPIFSYVKKQLLEVFSLGSSFSFSIAVS